MYIPNRDANGDQIIKSSSFADAQGFRARFKGISGTAIAGQTTNVDIEISQERYINGVRLVLKNHAVDDKIHFEIVDKNNILGYGVNVVLDRFGEDWQVDDTVSTQPDVIVPYPAKIIAGLFIRIIYVSTGQTDVKVKANLYLHWKES